MQAGWCRGNQIDHMKRTKSTFGKTVEITLPPGDVGPICSYSPYCSPCDRGLGVWRKATLQMTAEKYEDVSRDDEVELSNTWILQLIRRELTIDLEQAEKKLGRHLEIDIEGHAADII